MGIGDTKGINPSLSLLLFQVLEEAGLGVKHFPAHQLLHLKPQGFQSFLSLLNSEGSRLLNALAVVTDQ